MRKSVFTQCVGEFLKEVSVGGGCRRHRNPAVDFTKNVKSGRYNELSDQEYSALLSETEEMAALWDSRQFQTADELFLRFFNKLELDSESLKKLLEILAGYYEKANGSFLPENAVPDAKQDHAVIWDLDFEADIPLDTIYYEDEEDIPDLCESTDSGCLQDPQKIYDYLSNRIYGQEKAVKAASILLYNHLRGRKKNILFAGPTGCGKTEIWRALQKLYPYIIIVDSTMLTMQGWSGRFKINDIFCGMSQREIEKSIVVFDEFDKFCEPKAGANGVDHGVTGQNELLKMIEGAHMVFPSEHGKPEVVFDSSGISFVFCGSFEYLIKERAEKQCKHTIGFGGAQKEADDNQQYRQKVEQEDLVRYANIRREIAGRINQIVQLQPMNAEDYQKILSMREFSPIRRLEQQYRVKLSISENTGKRLAREAAESRMGVRYLYSRIQQLLDEQIFLNWEQKEYRICEQEEHLPCK